MSAVIHPVPNAALSKAAAAPSRGGFLGWLRSGGRIGRAPSKASELANPVLDSRVMMVIAGLLVLAQLPQIGRLPIWLSVAGIGLIAARVLLLKYGKPAPHSYWLIPLVVIGTFAIRWHYGYFLGRDPGVALLFLMAGAKFMETRRERDGTLAVCLGAFLAMTQFLYEQSIISAVLLFITVLYIAFAFHALSGTWARPGRGMTRESLRPLVKIGAIMVLQSVPLAVVLFLMFPRLSTPMWGIPGERSSRTGLSEQMEFGNISRLSMSDDIAFHAEFADKSQIPANPDRYWRGPVLSQYDGRVWRTSPRGTTSPLPNVSGPTLEYTVMLEPHQQSWLFALELPAAMPRNDNGSPMPAVMLTREQQLVSGHVVAQRLIYRQSSTLAWRYPAQITETDIARLTRLPGSSNPRTRAMAVADRRKWSSDAHFVEAILTRFNREEYGYTMEPPPVGEDAVDDFLFETKKGFCEHYAGAFAFIMRAAGIPARVVTGYQGGEINPSSGAMVIRQSDAHAWAEVLLNGNWVRVDPTAAVSPERIERGLAHAIPESERLPFLARAEWSWLRAIEWRMDAVNHGWQKWVIGFDHDRQQSLFHDLGWPTPKPWQAASLIVVAFAAWGLGYLGWSRWLRRIRTSDPLERAWLRINRKLARAGMPRLVHEGPLAYSERLCARWPQHAGVWREVSGEYALARYGDYGDHGGGRGDHGTHRGHGRGDARSVAARMLKVMRLRGLKRAQASIA